MDEPKVVSYTSKKRFRPSKRSLLVAGLITLALLCGAALAWLRNDGTDAPDSSKTGVLEDRLPKDVKEIQELALSGNIEEAEKKIQEGLSRPGVSDETKYNLLVQKGVTYQNEGKYKEAHSAYKEAEEVKSEYKISKLIADNALAMDNKALALTYYKKAHSQLDKSSPFYEGEKEIVESKIRELEG